MRRKDEPEQPEELTLSEEGMEKLPEELIREIKLPTAAAAGI